MFAPKARFALTRAAKSAANQNSVRQMSVITLSDEDAIEKFRMINSKSVLYFTASWCPPCKAISPIYSELSKKYPDVAFGKVDVDECEDAALDFEVRSVPTFVVFEGEVAKEKFVGADANRLEAMIKTL